MRLRINENIRAREVRVIDEKGKQVGVLPTIEAIKMAYDKGIDLVEIVSTSNPPVCKIIDYTKFKYEQERKMRSERKKQKVLQIKEVRFRPKIDVHDLEFKINHARNFLEEKHKVKLNMMFLGRELEHRELGLSVIAKIRERISDLGVFENEPRFEGNKINVLVNPIMKK